MLLFLTLKKMGGMYCLEVLAQSSSILMMLNNTFTPVSTINGHGPLQCIRGKVFALPPGFRSYNSVLEGDGGRCLRIVLGF